MKRKDERSIRNALKRFPAFGKELGQIGTLLVLGSLKSIQASQEVRGRQWDFCCKDESCSGLPRVAEGWLGRVPPTWAQEELCENLDFRLCLLWKFWTRLKKASGNFWGKDLEKSSPIACFFWKLVFYLCLPTYICLDKPQEQTSFISSLLGRDLREFAQVYQTAPWEVIIHPLISIIFEWLSHPACPSALRRQPMGKQIRQKTF